jgi:hypothetical protein
VPATVSITRSRQTANGLRSPDKTSCRSAPNFDKKVVDFPNAEVTPEEEHARRLRVEVERLARLPVVEWMFYLDDVAKTRNIEPAKLKAMIEATIKAAEKKAQQEQAEERQREQRAEQQRADARREDERKRREQQREQERAEKEAEKKQREREKEFAAILKLPSAEHESRLAALAKRSGEDPDFIREEFLTFVAAEEKCGDTDYVEPWPEPVDINVLLTEAATQLRRYVVTYDDAAAVAITLWIAFAWVHEIAVHSAILEFTSAEPDTGKTTACGVLKFLTPRAYAAAELTGPNLYRFVDHLTPTLIIDDADRLFERKPDLVHIVNVGWTRGTKIPRQDHGVTRWFDPFCPKVVAGVGILLPNATKTRTITIKLLPKLPSEKAEDFKHVDDDIFVSLRRKFARFAIDHAAPLKDADPVMSGFSNRAKMNWKVQVAIADLAGGDWPKAVRAAAVKLTRERREPSEGKRLLSAFRDLFTTHGPLLTSAEVQSLLTTDQDSEWADFRGRGPISKTQIAALLDPYDIHPDVVHPRGRKAERGYKAEWFETTFKHFLGETPTRKRTTVRKPLRKPQK